MLVLGRVSRGDHTPTAWTRPRRRRPELCDDWGIEEVGERTAEHRQTARANSIPAVEFDEGDRATASVRGIPYADAPTAMTRRRHRMRLASPARIECSAFRAACWPAMSSSRASATSGAGGFSLGGLCIRSW